MSFHGPRWCFKGAHSTRRLPSSDRRCIDKASITLVAGPQLQQQIDALPAEVYVARLGASAVGARTTTNPLRPAVPFTLLPFEANDAEWWVRRKPK